MKRIENDGIRLANLHRGYEKHEYCVKRTGDTPHVFKGRQLSPVMSTSRAIDPDGPGSENRWAEFTIYENGAGTKIIQVAYRTSCPEKCESDKDYVFTVPSIDAAFDVIEEFHDLGEYPEATWWHATAKRHREIWRARSTKWWTTWRELILQVDSLNPKNLRIFEEQPNQCFMDERDETLGVAPDTAMWQELEANRIERSSATPTAQPQQENG